MSVFRHNGINASGEPYDNNEREEDISPKNLIGVSC
jgi:hypothetical protein